MLKSGVRKLVCIFSLSVMIFNPATVSALIESRKDMFAENNILFYDPDGMGGRGCGDIPVTDPNGTGGTASSSGYERLKGVVRQYGEMVMGLQKKYGVPWEVVFAQMQKESQTGTAGIAVKGATNNWLGITGSGDAGFWTSSTGRKWAKFSSVEAMVDAWAGRKVLRNGYYDDAFPYLDPNNYNLEMFLKKMISHYAPSSDGNDEEKYRTDVLSIINGPIAAVRQEMGWPSSAELAKQENIPIGGEFPIGSSVSSGDVEGTPSECPGGGGNGDINKTAIMLSWPDRSHANNDPKPEYYTALHAPDGVATNGEGDSCSMGGNSCDAFLATTMRYSGVDPGFPCCGANYQLRYLSSHPELYEDVTSSISSSADMKPGDIRAKPSHVEIYVVLEDGSGKIASASHCDRTADHGMGYYTGSGYRVFRKK